MYPSSLLGALLLAVPTLGVPGVSSIPSGPNSPAELQPIDIKAFESAFGIQRRTAVKLSALDPQTQEQLIYGRPGEDGQLILANMTLYADDGLPIVLMERFEGLTKSIDCKGDDGSMSLTFNSENAFQYALKSWDFINQSPDKRFLLIANHDGCGPNDQRQPYLITNIREDTASLTTYLSAQVAAWSEVRNYDLDIGHAVVSKGSSSPSRRGLIQDISNGLQGKFNYDKSKTFSVAVGTPNKPSSILDTSAVKIDCANCYVTGSFTLAGHVSVKNLKPKELTLTVTPSGLAAELELSTTITASAHPDTLSYSKTLYSAPIPAAGIAVPGIFSLGAIVSYDVGASASFSGSATVQYGLSASIPDSAKIVADLLNPSSSSATGFAAGQVTPNFGVTALSAGLTLAAFSQPKLSFGIELNNIAKFDAAFDVKLPEVVATLTGGYNAAGLCAPGTSTTGVNLTSNIFVEVDFELEAELGKDKHSFTKKLFGYTHPLAAKCFPVAIPGLGPKIPSIKAPPPVTLPSATSVVTAGTTSVGTAVPIPTTGPGNGSAPVVGRRVRLA